MLRKLVVLALLAVSLSVVVFAGWLLLGGNDPAGDCEVPEPVRLEPRVVETHPHDPDAFTQGLLVDDSGSLWESTGLRGESEIRQVDVETGEVLESRPLDPELFGEGLTQAADGELVQLTWTSGRALRWQRSPLMSSGGFDYEGEGWGITTLDDTFYAMSDGSSTLAFRSPEDFARVGEMELRRGDGPVGELNELEWDGDRLWANRYQSDEILRVELDCGVVDGVVDAGSLRALAAEAIGEAGLDRDLEDRDVLNGIAWLGEDTPERYYVTGKRWPLLFEVEFVERRADSGDEGTSPG